MSSEKEIAKWICDNVASEPVAGLRKGQILERMGHVDASYFRQILKKLVKEGSLVVKRGGRYVLAQALARHNGVFHRNPKGFGFVTLDRGGEDIFIPLDKTLGALSGDRVQISVSAEEDPRGASGEVISILERAREDFVGCLSQNEFGIIVRPLRRDLPSFVPLHQEGPKAALEGAALGEWVQCSFLPRTDPRARLEAAVIRRIGKSGSIAGDIGAVCKEFGLPRPYASTTEKRAQELVPLEVPRRDCLDLEVFTVDPVDAKDFDDGISYMENPDGVTAEVGVHIADVACFVPPDSSLDKAARERGFTSYLPGKTIGMLPDVLSSDLCSLRQGEERLAHSVFLTIERETGRVLKSRRIHTRIRSRRRLCFDQVERLLAGEEVADVSESLCDTLFRLNALTRTMRQWRRNEEQFLPFTLPEVRVLCSGKPARVVGVNRVLPTAASEMIEELMLAANVAVGQEMLQRKIPGFFRNHADPTSDSLQEIAGMAMALTGGKKRLSLAHREQLISFMERLPKMRGGELLAMNLLRALARAEYGIRNEGHFGLGKEIYCHFTSPIRRYPDLLNHQQLLATDQGKACRKRENLEEIAQACNALEYTIDQASFAISDRLKLRLMEREAATTRGFALECLVAKVSSNGLLLFIPLYGMMGFLEIESLPGFWRYDAKKLMLECRSSRRRYRFGDTIYTVPLHLDTVRGELLLKPAPLFA